MKITTYMETRYELNFNLKEDRGAGFGFPCDAEGNVDTDAMTDCAKRNYQYCIDHPEEYYDPYVEKYSYTYKHGKCDKCGKVTDVFVDRYGEFRCSECRQLYNAFGQMLDYSAWDSEDYEY